MVPAIFEFLSFSRHGSKHFMNAKLSFLFFFFLRNGSIWEGDRVSKIPCSVLETIGIPPSVSAAMMLFVMCSTMPCWLTTPEFELSSAAQVIGNCAQETFSTRRFTMENPVISTSQCATLYSQRSCCGELNEQDLPQRLAWLQKTSCMPRQLKRAVVNSTPSSSSHSVCGLRALWWHYGRSHYEPPRTQACQNTGPSPILCSSCPLSFGDIMQSCWEVS